MAASQAIAFLNTIGAKKPNVYFRAGRKPKLTWVLKGKTFGVELDLDDTETGTNAIPAIRDIIQKAGSDSMAAKTMAAMIGHDYSLGGVRLKYLREEATLKRQTLSHTTGIDIHVLKDMEEAQTPNLEDRLTVDDIVAIAKACNADPNWLAGREIVEPPIPIFGDAPEDGDDDIDESVAPEPIAIPVMAEERAAIGARIKIARRNADLSQVAFGSMLDVSGVTISLLENGNPSRLWSELSEVAANLNTTEKWLRYGSETSDPAAGDIAHDAPPPPASPAGNGIDYAGIGERLKLAREAIGMSQADLADTAGVPTNIVGYAEKGQTTVLSVMLDEIAEYLFTTEEWLDTGLGDPPVGVVMPGTNSAVKPPILLKAGQTRVTETLQRPVQRQYRESAPMAASKPQAPVAASTVPIETLKALQAHLDKRLDTMADMARLRHEEMRSAIDEQTRLIKEVFRLLKQPPVEPVKKAKNPKRVEAGQRRWQLKGETTEAAAAE